MKSQEIFDQPLIAFDKSNNSLNILQIVDRMRSHMSKVVILNVHNPRKTYIPVDVQGQGINTYLLERYPTSTHADVTIESKAVGQKNTNVIILETFVSKSSSILLLGFVGLKGRKVRSKDLSSRLRQFVYESRLNLGIVKCQDKKTDRSLFLFDGSDTSVQGLKIAVGFCIKFNQALTVLHVHNADLKKHSKHVRIQLKSFQEEHPHAKFSIIIEEGFLISSLHDKAKEYDWIIFNKNGYRGSINKMRFVGENASRIIEQIEANIILLN